MSKKLSSRRRKAKDKKTNARSPRRGRKVIVVPPDIPSPTEGEIASFRRQILELADRILPWEARADFTPATLTRMNRNASQALAYFTEDAQRVVCIEEMAELIQLLARVCAGKDASREAIQEEIADVYITVGQMARIYFSGKTEFNKVVNSKLTKQECKLSAARSLLMA